VGRVPLPPLSPNFPDDGEYYVFTQSYLSYSRRVDAARHNSERSTGPRSEAGKERMRMNALKHGCEAAPENDAAVMRALGEDPERYAAMKCELATAYGPGDAGLKASATTDTPKGENAPEIPKSPEQSENIIENKGPAAQKRADEGARPGGDAGM